MFNGIEYAAFVPAMRGQSRERPPQTVFEAANDVVAKARRGLVLGNDDYDVLRQAMRRLRQMEASSLRYADPRKRRLRLAEATLGDQTTQASSDDRRQRLGFGKVRW